MTDRDWQFAFGSLGDPLADIEDWMLPPRPKWVGDKEKRERKAYGKRQTDTGR